MRVDRLESAVVALVALCVLSVVGGVFALGGAFPGGLRSGVPEVAARSDASAEDWRWRYLVRAGHAEEADLERRIEPQPPATGADPRVAAPPARATGRAAFAPARAPLPLRERVFPQITWLRRRPGVTYKRPRRVSRIVHERLQSFSDSWNAAQAGGGAFVETAAGATGYRLTWLDPRGELTLLLGLRPGDVILAVNGQPIGRSVDSGRALFEQLRSEARFTVLVERGGREVVLSFYVP